MLQLFARPKPCRIMMLLRDGEWHLSKLAKNSDTSYVYVTHLVSKLAASGFVVVEPKGKKKLVKLTEKGVAVANIITELTNKLQ